MSGKSKKKSKAKSKTNTGNNQAAALPVAPGSAVEFTAPDDATANNLPAPTGSDADQELYYTSVSEFPTKQKIFIVLSLLVLAAVIFFVIFIGVNRQSGSDNSAIRVLPSNTPGGVKYMKVDKSSPLLQDTGLVQAAPAINSGNSSTSGSSFQQGSGSLQEQAPFTQ